MYWLTSTTDLLVYKPQLWVPVYVGVQLLNVYCLEKHDEATAAALQSGHPQPSILLQSTHCPVLWLTSHPPSHKSLWFSTLKTSSPFALSENILVVTPTCSLIKDYSPSSGRETHLGNYDLSPARLPNLFDNFQTLNNLSRQYTRYKLY